MERSKYSENSEANIFELNFSTRTLSFIWVQQASRINLSTGQFIQYFQWNSSRSINYLHVSLYLKFLSLVAGFYPWITHPYFTFHCLGKTSTSKNQQVDLTVFTVQCFTTVHELRPVNQQQPSHKCARILTMQQQATLYQQFWLQ